MIQIIKPDVQVVPILGKYKKTEGEHRMMRYCKVVEHEDGVLVFNLMTREMVLLTKEEYADILESEYMKEHRFVVPVASDDKKQMELIRWVCASRKTKPQDIVSYTILTTTECNARCFYCYELGYARVTMSLETADKVAAYIIEHCGGKKVRFSWFGGEPLVNYPVIDRICARLREAGVAYSSTIVSNGYLMDEQMATKAVTDWCLNRAQITLDGTEEVYNKSKAFIYREGSAFRVVLENIGHLLAAGVRVQIRLNMNLKNANDLIALIDVLKERFAGQKNLVIYSHFIMDSLKPQETWYTKDEWRELYERKAELEQKIVDNGFAGDKASLRRNLKMNYCMADSGRSRVVVPDGHIGLCEHCAENEYIGHVDSDELDKKRIAEWSVRTDDLPECGACVHYPDCYAIKKCPTRMYCDEYSRAARDRKLERLITKEYERFQAGISLEEDSEDEEPDRDMD